LRSAQILVNGKRRRTLRGRSLRVPVTLRDLPAGTFSVRIVARTRAGRTIVRTRRYRGCTRACRSRRQVAIRLPSRLRGRVRHVAVHVDGRRVRSLEGTRSRVVVTLRGRRRGRYAVRLVVRTAGGGTTVIRRAYRTCTPKPRRSR
jgi:hypothetical protein